MQARKKLCAIYGEDVLRERQRQNWFSKFYYSNFNLKDARSGRPIEIDDNKIKTPVNESFHDNTRNC